MYLRVTMKKSNRKRQKTRTLPQRLVEQAQDRFAALQSQITDNAISQRVVETIGFTQTKILGLFNLPTRREIDGLRKQLRTLESQMGQLKSQCTPVTPISAGEKPSPKTN